MTVLSDENIDQLEKRLSERFGSQLTRLAWMLVGSIAAGAFIIGSAVADIRAKNDQQDYRLTEIETARQKQLDDWNAWRAGISENLTDTRRDVAWIKDALGGKK